MTRLIPSATTVLYQWRGWLLLIPILRLLGSRLQTESPLQFGFLFPVGLGCLLRLWAGAYGNAHTNGSNLAAPVLMQQGPYALMRHPLYVGNAFVALGCMGFANAWSGLEYFFWIGMLALFFHKLADAEEIYLSRVFPGEYKHYAATVPRWGTVASIKRSVATFSNLHLATLNWHKAFRLQARNVSYAVLLPSLITLAAYFP